MSPRSLPLGGKETSSQGPGLENVNPLRSSGPSAKKKIVLPEKLAAQLPDGNKGKCFIISHFPLFWLRYFATFVHALAAAGHRNLTCHPQKGLGGWNWVVGGVLCGEEVVHEKNTMRSTWWLCYWRGFSHHLLLWRRIWFVLSGEVQQTLCEVPSFTHTQHRECGGGWTKWLSRVLLFKFKKFKQFNINQF